MRRVLAGVVRFAKTAVAGAVIAALAGCGGEGLDSLPSGGRAVVAGVEADGRLRFEDGRRLALAGIEVADAAPVTALTVGREVELLAPSADSGRAHIRVRRSRTWVQGELLDRGVARVWTAADERTLAAAMLTREARARAAGRGLWSGRWRVLTADEALDARRRQIIEGRVRRVSVRRRGVFLDFGVNWRDDLSVEVPAAALDAFAAAGRDPAGLEGRLVRVRGRLQPTRNGPLITLDHPEALEPLREP